MGSRPNRLSYRLLVSACLAGVDCTYRGKNNCKRSIKMLAGKGIALPVCPEVMGGLGVPREMSEIANGDGRKVIDKSAQVVTISGRDVSRNYISGAKKVLRLAKQYRIKKAILKSNSPACGIGYIYDGTFRRCLKRGDGVLTALLKENNIKVYSERSKKY